MNRNARVGNTASNMVSAHLGLASFLGLAACSAVATPRVDASSVTDAPSVTDASSVTDAPSVTDAGCTSIWSDPANCGECGRACGATQRCEFGACVCPEGVGACVALGVCDTSLIDNPQHCGACGARCFDGERCVGTRCERVACASGFTDCVDPATPCETELARDDRHCGACGNACATGARCVAGRCVSSTITPQMPGSMLATTSARPWFRWAIGSGVEGARLQVCADPACARVERDVVVTGTHHRPTEALGAGVHYWRLFPRRGAVEDSRPGPVWAFVVPPTDALGARDTAPRLDLDGDGAEDEIRFEELGQRSYGLRVRYGVRPGGEPRPERLLVGEMRAFELGAATVVHAGDLDGDGLGDALVEVAHNVRRNATESDGAVMLFEVYGRRDADPVVRLAASVQGTFHPGPRLEAFRALGNAEGYAGLLTLVGNAPHCMVRFHRGLGAPLASVAFSCGNELLTSGDYDADGRVDVLTDRPPQFYPHPGEPSSAPRDCAGSQHLAGSTDPHRQVVTADVDVDGYDDLVVVLPAGKGRHVVHGGPASLDGTRCSVLP